MRSVGEYATESRGTPDVRGSTDVEDPYSSAPVENALQLVLQAIASAEQFHTPWVEKIEKRYRAYRGMPEKKQKDVQRWRSKLTTPYILQLLEGMLATMLDPKPTWRVTPKPHPGEQIQEVLGRRQSARVAQAALQWAMDEDDFALKQREFMQQDLIAGITVVKVAWQYEARDMNRLIPVEMEVVDEVGRVRDRYTDTTEQEEMVVLRDGPTMIVRDVRDFFWPQSAKSVDDAAWVIDRSWVTYESLMEKERAGLYEHCELLKDKQETTGSTEGANTEREQSNFGTDRTAGLIEVLEYWTDDRLIVVGGREVVLYDKRNPLRIKRKPFVVCAAMPDAFQMVGISVVESLAQLQEYLWTLQNQRIDALRLLTNVITLIRSDVDDPDSFEFFPGAQWIVEDPGQVGQLQIDATAAQITLEAEALIKGDLQNMLGGLPMAGGVSSGAIDQETATGMSIITSIAQKLIQARKQQYMWAYSQVAEMFLGMMGQMLREQRVISQIGPEGKQQLMEVHPLDLQGEFDVNVDVMDESTVREQERSEAMALMNMAAGLGPAAGLVMKPFMEKVLNSYGITNTEEFFQAGPPALPAGSPPATPAGAQGIAEGMQPPGGPMGSGGQTNPGLAAAMGGGNGLSMSPNQFAGQQLQAVQQMGMGAQG